jgi:hypothetical protein
VTNSIVAPSDLVIPAKAGIQTKLVTGPDASWIPAFAGMTR